MDRFVTDRKMHELKPWLARVEANTHQWVVGQMCEELKRDYFEKACHAILRTSKTRRPMALQRGPNAVLHGDYDAYRRYIDRGNRLSAWWTARLRLYNGYACLRVIGLRTFLWRTLGVLRERVRRLCRRLAQTSPAPPANKRTFVLSARSTGTFSRAHAKLIASERGLCTRRPGRCGPHISVRARQMAILAAQLGCE